MFRFGRLTCMQKVQLSDLGGFAKQVVEGVQAAPPSGRAYLVVLHGDLGAGKTTFVQALAKVLGVEDTIQSPTYVLMKSYTVLPPGGGWLSKLVHIDAYRLNDPEEFKTLKPEEFLNDPTALVVLEWPERIEGQLPTPDMSITFSSEGAGDRERYIEVTR